VVPSAAPGNAMALALVAARAQRRGEARELVLRNPAAALELKVGRPDIPNRHYDDGGLVDVNHVPAEWLVAGLEITPAQAGQIVDVREQRGGFLAPDEVLVHCSQIQAARFELIRDRVVVLPY
jgi:DNA uptake protein ComE-like DNA-binding protein